MTDDWADRYRDVFTQSGLAVRFVGDGAVLATALVADWSVEVVVLDLALAVPELTLRLGPAGPRVLAFGDPTNAGIALAANLADFIDAEPDGRDLVAAVLGAQRALPVAIVADLSDRTSARIGALGTEAGRIAAALARLEMSSDGAMRQKEVDPAVVRALVRARRARERFFPADIFADPAWDMLLDLTLARAEAREVSVSSLCIAACVPSTTALRWIRTLSDLGLFERRSDPGDARRAFIALAEPAAAAMASYLATCALPGS